MGIAVLVCEGKIRGRYFGGRIFAAVFGSIFTGSVPRLFFTGVSRSILGTVHGAVCTFGGILPSGGGRGLGVLLGCGPEAG